VLAVDTARRELTGHVAAAVQMTKDVAHADDKVIVLHVHEFAVGRFGRMQVDCADGQGEPLVARIVENLSASGLSAEGIVKEADFGHVARAILAAAEHYQAKLLVLGLEQPDRPALGSLRQRGQPAAAHLVAAGPDRANAPGNCDSAVRASRVDRSHRVAALTPVVLTGKLAD
jgi:hypothetical protein